MKLASAVQGLSNARALAVGGLKNDNLADLVVTMDGTTADTDQFEVWTGNRDGWLSPRFVHSAQAAAWGLQTDRVQIADVDGDGNVDLVITLFSPDSSTGKIRVVWGLPPPQRE